MTPRASTTRPTTVISWVRDPGFLEGTYLTEAALNGAPMTLERALAVGLDSDTATHHDRLRWALGNGVAIQCWSCSTRVEWVRYRADVWTLTLEGDTQPLDIEPHTKVDVACGACGKDQRRQSLMSLVEQAWDATLRFALDNPWFRDHWMTGTHSEESYYDQPSHDKPSVRLRKP